MPSPLTDLGFVPDAGNKAADLSDLGFVPDKAPAPLQIKLSPIEQVQMQSGNVDPEIAGAEPQAMLQGNDSLFTAGLANADKPESTGAHLFDFWKNLTTLPLTTPVAAASEVAEPIASQAGNALASDLFGKTPFKPGQPIIPAPAANQQGIIPAIQRAASGFSTPGSILMLGAAPESKLVQGGFMAGAAGTVPDSLQKMATAKNGAEFRDAATELGLNVGMAALMGRGMDAGRAEEAPTVPPEPAPAQVPAKSPLDDLGFVPENAPKTPQEQLPPPETAATPPNASPAQASAQPATVKATVTPETATPIDTANVQVRTPDGQIDPVQTAIARMRLEQAQTETPIQPGVKPPETAQTAPETAVSPINSAGQEWTAKPLSEQESADQDAMDELQQPLDADQIGADTEAKRTALMNEQLHGKPDTFVPEPGSTFADKAEQIAQKLEGLKSGIGGGTKGNLNLFGVVPDVWDRAVGLAQYLIRSGGKVADAIDEAIRYIKKNFAGQFDEAGARQHFQSALGQYVQERSAQAKGGSEYIPGESEQPAAAAQPEAAPGPTPTETPPDETPEVPPTPGSRPVATVKSDVAAAQTELQNAIKARPGTGQAGAQRQAMATAKYRNLRDELLNHPDYVAENLKAHNDAVTEANSILKPHGLAVRADFPNPATLQQKLAPAELKRFEELSKTISDTHAELNRMPKKLVSSVHAQMEKDGRLPKSPSLMETGAGRTLDRLTDALNKAVSDSPRRSLTERLSDSIKIADKITNAKDFLTRAMARAKAAWNTGIQTFKRPPEDDNYRSIKKSWIHYDQETAVENYRTAKALVAKVPEKVRRMAMSVWLDAGGDENILRSQLADVPQQYKAAWQAALKLTPFEKQTALNVKREFADKLDDALATGLVEKGRDDYGVPQRWKTSPQTGEKNPFDEGRKGSPGNPYAKLDPRDPFFSFQRSTPSYFDGIMAKGVPENLDIAHLVTVYDEAFHKALGSRGWIGALQDATAKDGMPVVKVSGVATKASGAQGDTFFVDSKAKGDAMQTADGRPYKSVDHFALRAWKVRQKDSAGNPIIVKGDMLIHPDYFDDVKNELETPKWMKKLDPGEKRPLHEKIGYGTLKFSAFLKASKFVGPFHVVTEALHASTHGAAGILSDITHGDIGSAWSRRGELSPSVRGFQIDLKDPQQAMLSRNMTLGFGKARELFEDGLGSNKGIWAHFPTIGNVLVKMNHFTFDEYIPRLKMKVGLAVLERNMAQYKGKLSPEQIAEQTGKQMDAAFGGQNWRLMGANKNLLGLSRIALVAPDFLLSRAKVIGQALRPYNAEQRNFLVAQAVGVYVLARILNATFSDNHDPQWDPKYWDSVVIGNRAYHARFLVSDAANFAKDVFGFGKGAGMPFISGRAGVAPKMAYEVVSGRDMYSGREIFPGHHGAANSLAIVVRDLGQWMTPMALDGYISGKSRDQTGPGQIAAAFTGISSTPINQEPTRKREARR